MKLGCFFFSFLFLLSAGAPTAQSPSQSSSSSSSSSAKRVKKPAPDSPFDVGTINQGVYRNAALGFSCKVPPGWVLRTDDMNARDDEEKPETPKTSSGPAQSGHVLLAAFSRPPEARAEDVNASILIAAESVSAYPGLTQAAQYLAPVTEVAKAQGLQVVEEPYEFPVGAKTLARTDFQKDVGTRVLRQSTLVMLARGYAVSFTFIAGTDDEIDELVDGLSFVAGRAGTATKK
jgi:hypothetical protein